jgi:hypothetical protein
LWWYVTYTEQHTVVYLVSLMDWCEQRSLVYNMSLSLISIVVVIVALWCISKTFWLCAAVCAMVMCVAHVCRPFPQRQHSAAKRYMCRTILCTVSKTIDALYYGASAQPISPAPSSAQRKQRSTDAPSSRKKRTGWRWHKIKDSVSVVSQVQSVYTVSDFIPRAISLDIFVRHQHRVSI